MANKYYNIGGLVIRFCSDIPIGTNKLFTPFITEAAVPHVTVNIIRGRLPAAEEGVVVTYPENGEERPYACRVKKEHNRYDLYVDYPLGIWDSMLFLALDFAELLLENNRVVCHCSCILRQGEAVLFAGQKQAGKSTQAALWQQYGGAEIINGDRAILSMGSEGLLAWGTPYCGSSRIALNKTAPVKAIILPKKSSENRIRLIGNNHERFTSLLPHLTYDTGHIQQALDMAEAICTAVPVYTLNCRPDKEAVHITEQVLWKQRATDSKTEQKPRL